MSQTDFITSFFLTVLLSCTKLKTERNICYFSCKLITVVLNLIILWYPDPKRGRWPFSSDCVSQLMDVVVNLAPLVEVQSVLTCNYSVEAVSPENRTLTRLSELVTQYQRKLSQTCGTSPRFLIRLLRTDTHTHTHLSH